MKKNINYIIGGLTLFLLIVILASCQAAKFALWDAATDVGIQAIEKRFPDFEINIPLKGNPNEGFKTPLGFVTFFVYPKQDTILVYAVPQYAVIGDSIKAVGRKILKPKKAKE